MHVSSSALTRHQFVSAVVIRITTTLVHVPVLPFASYRVNVTSHVERSRELEAKEPAHVVVIRDARDPQHVMEKPLQQPFASGQEVRVEVSTAVRLGRQLGQSLACYEAHT